MRAIAAVLGLAESTVRGHLARVCRHLELRGRPDLVRFTARAGLNWAQIDGTPSGVGLGHLSPLEL
jgi:hypothetical protein